MDGIYPVIGQLAVHDAANVALFLSLVGMFLLAAVASAGAVTAAVRRSGDGARLYRFALYPAALAALSMAVVLLGTVVWGLALRATAPALFSGADGILETSTVATWLAVVAVMALSTSVAAHAVIRGILAGREAPETS